MVSDEQKTRMKQKCYIFLLGPAAFVTVYSVINPGITKQYNRCTGKEEQYFFNVPDFLEESSGGPMYGLPVWHPFRVFILLLFDSYLVLVPFAYLRIFLFRRKLKTKQNNETILKKRNIVSTGYNMSVWIVEGFVTLMVSKTIFNNYGLDMEGLILDPPLNALSWNLKDSHVFSGK